MGNDVGIIAGLKILDIFFDDEKDLYRGDPSYILSKVTGLIAFKRCPDLKVILATSSDRWKRGEFSNF